MCTVTYVPHQKGYFLTSNRDEKNTRSQALLPEEYSYGVHRLIFPKDKDAGGTWITLKENGDSLCLLNGAFTNFIDNGLYTVSRGKIVLEIAADNNLVASFKNINLAKTAPFTLVIVYKTKLFECRWDGQRKHCNMLDNSKPYIWSSATLYDSIQQEKREKWFEQFLQNNKQPCQIEIMHFHKNTGDGNRENDLVMNRDDQYFTVSISSIAISENEYTMQYEDLIYNDINTTRFAFANAAY